jgi:hypothetical protein
MPPSLSLSSSLTPPTPLAHISSSSTSSTTSTSTTTSQASTEPFTNIFSEKFSSPYWNANGNDSTDFFANTKFKPSCCKKSNYSTSQGCACLSSKQDKYLKTRGDNNKDNKLFYFF